MARTSRVRRCCSSGDQLNPKERGSGVFASDTATRNSPAPFAEGAAAAIARFSLSFGEGRDAAAPSPFAAVLSARFSRGGPLSSPERDDAEEPESELGEALGVVGE